MYGDDDTILGMTQDLRDELERVKAERDRLREVASRAIQGAINHIASGYRDNLLHEAQIRKLERAQVALRGDE